MTTVSIFKDRARRLQNVFLFLALLESIANFMVVPLISLYVIYYLKMSPFIAAVMVFIPLFCRQGLAFVGGFITDVFDEKWSIFLGGVIAIIGYYIFYYSSRVEPLILAAIITGFGGGIIAIAIKTALARLAKEVNNKKKIFGLWQIFLNIGASFGALACAFLFNISFRSLFWVSMIIYLFCIFIAVFFIKKINSPITNSSIRYFFDLKRLLKNKMLIRLLLINLIYWFFFSQLNLIVPIYSDTQFHIKTQAGILLSWNGILVVIFQSLNIRLGVNEWDEKKLLSLGFFVLFFSFLIVPLAHQFWIMYAFMILFTISEVLIIPTIQSLTAKHSQDERIGTSLGFIALGAALGAIIGNCFGGWLMIFSPSKHYAYIFSLYAVFILVFSFFVMFSCYKYAYDRINI